MHHTHSPHPLFVVPLKSVHCRIVVWLKPSKHASKHSSGDAKSSPAHSSKELSHQPIPSNPVQFKLQLVLEFDDGTGVGLMLGVVLGVDEGADDGATLGVVLGALVGMRLG